MIAARRLLPDLLVLGIGLALVGGVGPARAHSLAELNQRLHARETYFQVLVNQMPMHEQVRFATIIADPVRDTPDVLRPGTRPGER
jgi:hypothetical protein